MTANYKQLAQELCDALKRVRCFSITDSEMDTILQKYEEATTRGTGRTTALYLKCITEALENPGKSVEFIDHYPHKWERARLHEDALKTIIEKLNYNIIVQTKGQAQVYLYNRFGL